MSPPDSQLHPLVDGFADAETYDRGRPRYGEDAARVLVEELGLGPTAPVLELGAGTGQLSRALVAAGMDVTAVEPLANTRELLVRAIGADRVRAGVAEEIPLADHSVDAVLAADAFHWFDESRAMPEIRRVLRPGGGVAILRSIPMWEAPWSAELGPILAVSRPDHPAYAGRSPAAALEQDGCFGPVRERTVTDEQPTDRARILAYLASVSWIATLPEHRRRDLLTQVESLLGRHGVTDAQQQVLHQIWIARLA